MTGGSLGVLFPVLLGTAIILVGALTATVCVLVYESVGYWMEIRDDDE